MRNDIREIIILSIILSIFTTILIHLSTREDREIKKLINSFARTSREWHSLGLYITTDDRTAQKIIAFGKKATPHLLKGLKSDNLRIIIGCIECIAKIEGVSSIPVLERELLKYQMEFDQGEGYAGTRTILCCLKDTIDELKKVDDISGDTLPNSKK